MEIIDIPIVDYLKLCRNIAEKRGFKWVMVFLARERDAIESYEDIKKYWDSYNDLTGNQILFVFSLANNKEEYYEFCPFLEGQEWVRAHNPSFLVMNEDVPFISKRDFVSRNLIQNYRFKAVENNTNFISDLCVEYGIAESQVPAILLFSTLIYMGEEPIIIPLSKDNLYDAIKEIVSSIGLELKEYKEYKEYKCSIEAIRIRIEEVRQKICECKLSKHERRYLHAKKFLSEVQVNKEERVRIERAIEKLDLNVCEMFCHPICGCLKQFINLSIAHVDIEICIKEKEFRLIELNSEINLLKAQYDKAIDNMHQAMHAINKRINDLKCKFEQEKNKEDVIILEGKEELNEIKNNVIYVSKK